MDAPEGLPTFGEREGHDQASSTTRRADVIVVISRAAVSRQRSEGLRMCKGVSGVAVVAVGNVAAVVVTALLKIAVENVVVVHLYALRGTHSSGGGGGGGRDRRGGRS